MKVTVDEINKIARLAKLKFSDEEAAKFADEFEKILDYFNALNKFSLDDIDLHAVEKDAASVTRADESTEFTDKQSLFSNVKSMRDTYIQVPKILE
ncbi:MAG: Asp-tRNA(Asn)/Glu-tRNA(Gln) amidotransferase subunit GatC [Bacillota bacterium]|nr:Asp-tRNA(Asn)/Glu-tRNA(Gln) amidotransferase subunit GatC [Bacillota bacterium]